MGEIILDLNFCGKGHLNLSTHVVFHLIFLSIK